MTGNAHELQIAASGMREGRESKGSCTMGSTLRIRHNAEMAYRNRYSVASPASGPSTFAGGIVDLNPATYVDGMPRIVETCAHKHRSRAAAWSCAEGLRDTRADEAGDSAVREASTRIATRRCTAVMRRRSVPRVEVASFSPRLEILLRSPEIAPVYDRKLQPLAGIHWQGLGTRRVPIAGEVAMFDVTEPGNLQEW